MLNQAPPGCVQNTLLWYKLLVSTLIDLGFKLNPFDLCVANSVIKNKQCAITWHADDNKIYHVEKDAVNMVIGSIENRFEKMVVSLGLEHDFIGTKIKFLEDPRVRVDMQN